MSFPIRIRKDLHGNGEGIRKSLPRKSSKKNGRRGAHRTLLYAAADNQTETCRALLEKGEDVNLQDPKTGAIAIHGAVEEGHADMVRLLLAYKANLTLPNLKGHNALHLAVLWGQSDIFEILLQAKASVEQRAKNSQNIFHWLPLSTLSETALVGLFHSQADQTVSYLLNQPETEGEWTPLHVACHESRKDLIRLYIEHGADIRIRTKDNRTPREILLARMEELRKDSKSVAAYQDAVSSIKFLSTDYFTQTQITRTLQHHYPSIYLQECELHDNTFYYLLLEMLELKQKQSANRSFTATPRVSGVSKFLTYLDLSWNHLTVLPPEIKHLPHLQYLDLSHNALVTLPITLGLFRQLRSLDVSHNQLRTLPPSFAELRDHRTGQITLTELRLEGNDLEAPPKRVIKQGIRAIIDHFADMLEGEDRTCREVSVCCLGGPGVGKTAMLRALSARQRGRSFLSRLASTSNVNLRDSSVPSASSASAAVEVIPFELKGVLKKALSHSGSGSLQMAKEMAEGSEGTDSPLNMELLWKQFRESDSFRQYDKEEYARAYHRYFVASDLVDWLVSQSHVTTRADAVQIGKLFEKSGLIRSERKTTTCFADGKSTYTICEEASSSFTFSYSALDFSRFAINSPVPKFFMNACSIILVVWDVRLRLQQSKLLQWMDWIDTYCPDENLSIILVGTHAEEKSSFQLENDLQTVQTELCPKHPRIRCITAVSSSTRQGIPELSDNLFRITAENLKKQGRFPAKFTTLRNAILQESQREVPVMFWEEFHEVASLFSLHGEELYDAAHFLLTTGALYYPPQSLVKETGGHVNFDSFFCISRAWMANVVVSLLMSSQLVDGIVTTSDLESVWRTASIPIFLLQPLVDLLGAMDVIFPIPENFTNLNHLSVEEVREHLHQLEKQREARRKQPRKFQRSSGSQNVFVALKPATPKYILPTLIPKSMDVDVFHTFWGDGPMVSRRDEYLEYSRVWRFSLLKERLWNRLHARFFQIAECVLAFSRHGLLMNKGNSLACLERDAKHHTIAIRVRTKNENSKKEIFELFRTLTTLVKSLTQYWFESSALQVLAPCPHCLKHYAKLTESTYRVPFHQLHLFPLNDCTAAASKGEQFLICPRVYKLDLSSATPDSGKSPQSPGVPKEAALTRGRFSGELRSRSRSIFRRSQDYGPQGRADDQIKRPSTPRGVASHPSTPSPESSPPTSSSPPLLERAKAPAYPLRKSRDRPTSLIPRSSSQNFSTTRNEVTQPIAVPKLELQSTQESQTPVRKRGLLTSVSLKNCEVANEMKDSPTAQLRARNRRPLETHSFSSSGKDILSSLSPRRRRVGTRGMSSSDITMDPREPIKQVKLLWDPLTADNRMFHARIRLDQLVPDLVLLDLDAVRVEKDDIQLGDLLGEGAFGEVRKGVYQGQTYAVKTLHTVNSVNFDEFSREVALMSKIQHPNLVNMAAFCTGPFMIVMEFVAGGELYVFLHTAALHQRLDWRMRTRIAIDIARGMSFLHSVTPPILHRDLKSPNILMTSLDVPSSLEEPLAKISDFGLSTHLFNEQVKQSTTKRDVQTPTWLAPEVLRAEPYGEKSDCYAMGIIMWELLVPGHHPFDEYDYGNFTSKLEEDIMSGRRPSIPAEYHPWEDYYQPPDRSRPSLPVDVCPEDLLKMDYLALMTDCWSPDPAKRPTFLQVAFKLTKRYKRAFP